MALRSARRHDTGRSNSITHSSNQEAAVRRTTPLPRRVVTSRCSATATSEAGALAKPRLRLTLADTSFQDLSQTIGGRKGSQSARPEQTTTAAEFARMGRTLDVGVAERRVAERVAASTWIKDFITDHREDIQSYDARFARKSEREILRLMLADCQSRQGGFAGVRHEAEMKASKFNTSSSRLISRALQSGWGTEARPLPRVQSSTNPKLARIFKEDPLDDGYYTARRKYEDGLERCYQEQPTSKHFFRNKGDIPDYGNFSNLGAALVKHTGKTF